MKVLLALALVPLLVAVALPMGMDMTGDCPMCTSPETMVLGICAGTLSLFGWIVLLASARLRVREKSARRFLSSSSIYRPPRLV